MMKVFDWLWSSETLFDWRRRRLEKQLREAALALMLHMGAGKAVLPLRPRDPTVTTNRGPGLITIETGR